MGYTLNDQMLQSFVDELDTMNKEAFNPMQAGRRVLKSLFRLPKTPVSAAAKLQPSSRGFIGDIQEAGHRIMHPIEGLREGWRDFSPVNRMAAMTSKDREAYMKGGKFLWVGPKIGPGAHLEAAGKTLGEAAKAPGVGGKIKSVAEELSRRGVTGAGGITKYMPVGQKALIPGFGAMGIPGVVNAPEAQRTGEGGALEMGLGELGSAAGMIAGGGLGLAPGIGLWYLAHKMGGRAGRIADRFRAGATPGEALEAPSPTQAKQQLETLEKYYGQGNANA